MAPEAILGTDARTFRAATTFALAGCDLSRGVTANYASGVLVHEGAWPHFTPAGGMRQVRGITFAASDKFRMLWATIPTETGEDRRIATLAGASLTQALRALPRPKRGRTDTASFTTNPDDLWSASQVHGASMSLTIDPMPVSVPDYRALILRLTDAADMPQDCLSVTPAYLAAVCSAFDAVGAGSVTIRQAAPRSAYRFACEPVDIDGAELHVSAVLMPVNRPR